MGDPYDRFDRYASIFSKLRRVGFMAPGTGYREPYMDPAVVHHMRGFSDGSNLVYDAREQKPLMLFEALEQKIWINSLLIEERQSIDEWIIKNCGTLYGTPFEVCFDFELEEMVAKKEFIDAFRGKSIGGAG